MAGWLPFALELLESRPTDQIKVFTILFMDLESYLKSAGEHRSWSIISIQPSKRLPQ
jgi:hypothetical protein